MMRKSGEAKVDSTDIGDPQSCRASSQSYRACDASIVLNKHLSHKKAVTRPKVATKS